MNRVKKALVSGVATVVLSGAAMVGLATAAEATPLNCFALEQQALAYYNTSQYYHNQGIYYGTIGNSIMSDLMFSYERAWNINWLNVQVC
jgi:uncharacterized membrane protein